MIKTIMILAIATTLVAGASVIGFISDHEAEAAPKMPKPIPPIDPILKPINATLNQLEKYHEQLVVIKFSLTATVDEIENNPGYNNLEVTALVDALGQIEFEAEDISDLAGNTIIPD